MKFVWMVLAVLFGGLIVMELLRHIPIQGELPIFLYLVVMAITLWRKDIMKRLERLFWQIILGFLTGVLLARANASLSGRDQLVMLVAPLVLVLILWLIFRNRAVRNWWEGEEQPEMNGGDV